MKIINQVLEVYQLYITYNNGKIKMKTFSSAAWINIIRDVANLVKELHPENDLVLNKYDIDNDTYQN